MRVETYATFLADSEQVFKLWTKSDNDKVGKNLVIFYFVLIGVLLRATLYIILLGIKNVKRLSMRPFNIYCNSDKLPTPYVTIIKGEAL